MQIVINVPEEQYKSRDYNIALISNIGEITYIGKGIPLPKGHGDLIDRSDLTPDSDYDFDGEFFAVSMRQINAAPIIVETDAEESEETE